MNVLIPEIKIESIQTGRKSPWQKLWQDKSARIGLIILAIFYLCALFADLIVPYSLYYNDSELANAPPTMVYTMDEQGNWRWPYVRALTRKFDAENYRQYYEESPDKDYPIKFFTKGEEYKILGIIPFDIHFFGVDKQARIFLLGSDINGRDNFSRLFFGAQKSLTIGFLGLFIAFPIGIIYGGISGFAAGIIDNVMMRVAEAFMSIPGFYLLIGMAALLPAGMSGAERFTIITVILSLVGWAPLARIIRGMVLAIKEEEFVAAAQASGMGSFENMIKHIIPQTASFIIVSATLQVPYFILSESGLSFIGLGIQQPDASWGNMLKFAMDNVNDLANQPWLLAPGYLIFTTILCFNMVGDVLRDVLDPKTLGNS